MKQTKRIISLVAIIAILLSASVVPAHAEEYVSRADIFSWIASQGKIGSIISQITGVGCPKNEDGRHVAHSCVYDGVAGHYVCTCDSCGDTFVATKSELHDAYDSHVSDMPLNGIDNTGCFLWYPTFNDFSTSNLSSLSIPYNADWPANFDSSADVIVSGSSKYTFTILDSGFRVTTYNKSGAEYNINPYNCHAGWKLDGYLTAPVYGLYSIYNRGLVHGLERMGNDAASATDEELSWWIYLSSDAVTADKGDSLKIISYEDGKFGHVFGANLTLTLPVFKVDMSGGQVGDTAPDSTLYTPDTRPGTISGKYLVQNGDSYEDSSTTIINEDDNSIYNPVTNTTTNYDSWSYDYSTRTYTMTDNTNNSTTTVTYGDENVTINEGGNTYNIYYGTVNNNGGGSDNQGGGSGSDDSGNSGNSGDTGIIAKLGEMLGTLVSGLLGGVTAFVSAVFDGLISLANVISDKFGQVVSAVLSWFAQIPELFAGFSAFLVAVFPFLPADVMLLLTFGLAAVVFIAIIKAIRR